MLTLDTSGLVALISPKDRYHAEAVGVLRAARGPYIIPTAIMAEIAYILETRAGPQLVLDLLQDLRDGAYSLDCGEHDLTRIQDLVLRYADLRLGFADAAVVACAERRAGRVLSTDRRHFDVVARGEGTISVLPELA
jgi:predicted nucleic acid-binding protein